MEKYSYKFNSISDLVSIIIPTHNRAHFLLETLKSIEEQDYEDIEIILVDDHSNDNTQQVINDYSKRSRFSVLYFKSDKEGACHARNIGIINSRGEYIQFFDDDDLVKQNFISQRVKVLQEKSLDFCTCNFEFFSNDEKSIIGEKKISNIDHNLLSHLYYFSLPTPCFLFKRKCIEKIGFWNEKVERLQDISYYHRLFKYNQKGEWLDNSLFKVRKHSKNITHKKDENTLINAWLEICHEWHDNGYISKIRLFCMNRAWDSIAVLKIKGNYIQYVKNVIKLLYRFPGLFFFFIIKVKLLHCNDYIYKGK